jgi:hypothetical protein
MYVNIIYENESSLPVCDMIYINTTKQLKRLSVPLPLLPLPTAVVYVYLLNWVVVGTVGVLGWFLCGWVGDVNNLIFLSIRRTWRYYLSMQKPKILITISKIYSKPPYH